MFARFEGWFSHFLQIATKTLLHESSSSYQQTLAHAVEKCRNGRSLLLSVVFLRLQWRVVIAFLAVIATSLSLLVPYFQREFINDVSVSHQNIRALAAVLSAFAAALFAQLFSATFKVVAAREGLFMQKYLGKELYEHAMHLSSEARGRKTVGETVNLFIQDIQAASYFIEEFFPMFLITVLSLAAAPLAIGIFYKVSLGPLLLVTGTGLSVSLLLGYRQSVFFSNNKINAEKRMSIVNEWLQNMRFVRILGWTKAFETRIHIAREKETANRLGMVTNGSTMNSIAQVLPLLINVAGVIALVQASHAKLAPGDIFSVLWVFGVFLVRPLRSFPFLVANFNDSRISLKRLERFFLLEREREVGGGQLFSSPEQLVTAKKGQLEVKNLSLTLNGRLLLKDISLNIQPGKFVAIVGEVGSGKSLLLHALLRAVPASFDAYRIDGMDALGAPLGQVRALFSYVPQEGFVMSASLRDNVVFQYGAPADRDSVVNDTLGVSQFQVFEENMPGGLETEIGERGVNLSGGQRQRVSLARSAFFDRPIVLLDDCLSAVDVDTERRLSEQLLCGLWSHKTRILVTHRLSVLRKADWIYFLQDGRVAAEGTLDQLMRTSDLMQAFAAVHKAVEEGKNS